MNAQSQTHSTQLSHAEELANCITHGIGFVLSIAGAALMTTILGNGNPWRTAGCGIFLASMIAVYAMSTLSHTFTSPRLRTLFRALDQGSIYLLIAGTFTPFAMTYLSGAWMWLLAACWVVALWGFSSKVLFAYRVESVSMWPCVILGAMPFASVPTLIGAVSFTALWFMVLGVVCYCIGLYFWLNDRKVRHFHAAWHVLVMAGSTAHFVAILMFVAMAR